MASAKTGKESSTEAEARRTDATETTTELGGHAQSSVAADQTAMDQAAKDQAATDQAAAGQAAQDQPALDRPAQDRPAQDQLADHRTAAMPAIGGQTGSSPPESTPPTASTAVAGVTASTAAGVGRIAARQQTHEAAGRDRVSGPASEEAGSADLAAQTTLGTPADLPAETVRDVLQPAASVTPALPNARSEIAAAPTTTHAAGLATPDLPATPVRAVPIEIGMRALSGSNRFDIRLDPEDLGRIDVRLDIDRERNEVKAHLVVDRVETLQLLKRDAGLLEQAFAQAGLTSASDGVNLSLRDQGTQGGRDGTSREGSRPSRGRQSAASDESVPSRTHSIRALGGLDIRI